MQVEMNEMKTLIDDLKIKLAENISCRQEAFALAKWLFDEKNKTASQMTVESIKEQLLSLLSESDEVNVFSRPTVSVLEKYSKWGTTKDPTDSSPSSLPGSFISVRKASLAIRNPLHLFSHNK
eukprot:TRINITY_DN3580_c2_g1_i1.p1 TRINITY_DN3580_c2_g1~~TRINITY_DN3580_c2_g1_i1.p1  ORF type:complete len:123 (+),score=38.32 TRINITY_DN3580_c2_g1_i1:327-695(+)